MNRYPISYEMAYQDRHSRLTTLFRLILAIPSSLFVAIYTLVAEIAIVLAWIALVFTAKYPRGLYNFISGWLRAASRLAAYEFLLTDEYPPFTGQQMPDYPLQINIAPPQERYSQVKVFFRIIIGIPIFVMQYLFSIWAQLMAIAAWFVIIVTGKLPYGLYEQQVLAEQYRARATAYFALLTDFYPPISDKSASEQSPAAHEPVEGA